MVRRHTPRLPLYLGAGDRSVSDRPTDSRIEFSSPALFLFTATQTLFGYSCPVFFCATSLLGYVAVADRFAQTLQPVARPGELDAQYCEPDRNNNNSRSGRHQHDDAEYEHGGTDHADDNSARGFISQMYNPLYQRTLPKPVTKRLILRLATVALPQ